MQSTTFLKSPSMSFSPFVKAADSGSRPRPAAAAAVADAAVANEESDINVLNGESPYQPPNPSKTHLNCVIITVQVSFV